MRNYTTQMDAARKGILTPELEIVAKKENMTTEALMKLVAEGKVAICANKNHDNLHTKGVESMRRTKLNVNLGVPPDCKDYDIEMQKGHECCKAWCRRPSWIFPAMETPSLSVRS